jgi:hypothetical protein
MEDDVDEPEYQGERERDRGGADRGEWLSSPLAPMRGFRAPRDRDMSRAERRNRAHQLFDEILDLFD